jgi:F0F1-type ATP synthase assembly protein I
VIKEAYNNPQCAPALDCGRIRFEVPEDPNRSAKPNALVSAARYSEIGFVIPAAVFLGYGLGWLFDRWLHTHWLYLAGVIFGAVVGFVQMIRMAAALSRDKSGDS